MTSKGISRTPEQRGLEDLQVEVGACRACPRLVAWRELVAEEKRASYRNDTYWGRGVPGFGDVNAKLLVVGLAPAAHGANRTGRLFTGDRSGDWLFRAMHRAGFANQPTSVSVNDGLSLINAYLTATVRCAPPDNKPLPEERDNCLPFLRRELAILQEVEVAVVLGKFAYDVFAREIGLQRKPKFGHGVEVEVETVPAREVLKRNGPNLTIRAQAKPLTVLCSFHPSQQNTFTGKLTELQFDSIFSRAKDLVA
jgi:uracil-DNA glycosylase